MLSITANAQLANNQSKIEVSMINQVPYPELLNSCTSLKNVVAPASDSSDEEFFCHQELHSVRH